MDPLVVLILTLIALGGGGAGGAAVLVRRRQRLQALRQALLDKVDHQGRALSIFDVFWDLGVSDYALALMDHHGLMLHEPRDFERAHTLLDDLIDAHGTYTDFLEDNLAAIQEFYRDHRHTGSRRKLPTLTLRDRKLLPVERPEQDHEESSTALVRKGESVPAVAEGGPNGRSDASIEADLGRIVQDSVDERRVYREELSPMLLTVAADEQMPSRRGVDVDDLVKLEPLQMLKNIFDGRLTDEVQKWWSFRHVRAAKSRLDEQFARFYEFYADLVARRDDFYEMLYDMAARWRAEARRIDELVRERPWRGEPFGDAAEGLGKESRLVAQQLARRARTNVDDTIERIHRFARDGDKAMAGYLLYLNHHAFFAGRAPEYGEHVQRIERQAYRVQEELRKLKSEGQL